MWLIFPFIAVFFLTYGGIEIYRRWSLKNSILDVPNERSSHQNPTPRGGGVIIVIVCLAAFSIINFFLPVALGWNYLIGALAVAAISWLDDLFRVNILWRFAVHALAAVIMLNGASNIYLPIYGNVEIGSAARVIWFLWIVWLLNAYNFMDGIDGIAGMQALTAGIGWSVLAWALGFENIFYYAALVTLAAAAFLFHNWQPAKIFMGDVGSAFLGYTFAVIPLLAQREAGGNLPGGYSGWFFAGIVFVYFFVFDSVLTFLRRALAGEKVWRAHRSHLYQRMTGKNWRHSGVTVLYGAFSLISAATFLGYTLLSNLSKIFGRILLIELIVFSAYLIYQGWIKKYSPPAEVV